ncbi:hypothetical protein BDK51DRAFT_28008 [Blyttiomyces helicus]|uniref:Acyltransferase 3 domain-containing protein n=1 Tax=Blyttiomyces helicus TaxID=388810 RepID=A0A4P9WBG0_9FUNG|nr:hypothetical protein BDK51DRAFT_28008 [Blyttiomyces helicus]|eukprot:RKO89592.1 hypothetical protein BDK51DRAFT_28008 [Blyttiomyces helicus]
MYSFRAATPPLPPPSPVPPPDMGYESDAEMISPLHSTFAVDAPPELSVFAFPARDKRKEDPTPLHPSTEPTPKQLKEDAEPTPNVENTSLPAPVSQPTRSWLAPLEDDSDWVQWVPALKFIAALMVFTGNFFQHTVGDSVFPTSSVTFMFRDTNWGILLLFALSARVLTAKLTPRDSGVRWDMLASSMFRRVFRFLLPLVAVILIQRWVAAAGHTSFDQFELSLVYPNRSLFFYNGVFGRDREGEVPSMGRVSLAEPSWGNLQLFSQFWYLMNNLFLLEAPFTYNVVGGMIWTTIYAWWGSYMVYVSFMVVSLLSNNRYLIILALFLFALGTYQYHTVFIFGFLVADIARHGHFKRVRDLPLLTNLGIQGVFATLMLAVKVILPLRNNMNTWGASLLIGQPGVQQTVWEASSQYSILFLLLLVECSPQLQFILSRKPLQVLGRLTPGLYLLHRLFFYTLLPSLSLNLWNKGTSSNSIIAQAYFACLAATLASAVGMVVLIEIPSAVIGRLVWKAFGAEVTEEVRSWLDFVRC